MSIPDYVSPIVAYRVWRWDGSGLASLIRGETWPTGHALTAQCQRAQGLEVKLPFLTLCFGSRHQAPQESCTCGIYAVRSLDQLPTFAIYGEVYLWGVVVEHKLGWRAQFAYPKNLVVPFKTIPVDEMEAKYLEALVAYGVDIFIDDGKELLPLWKKGSGYEPAGLDYMRSIRSPRVEEILRSLRGGKPPRGGTPPDSSGPPGIPPPPLVPVHSSWDISRILQCTRHRWPEEWTLAAAS